MGPHRANSLLTKSTENVSTPQFSGRVCITHEISSYRTEKMLPERTTQGWVMSLTGASSINCFKKCEAVA